MSTVGLSKRLARAPERDILPLDFAPFACAQGKQDRRRFAPQNDTVVALGASAARTGTPDAIYLVWDLKVTFD